MREKIKTAASIFIIVILLPYVAVVFCTGSMKGLAEDTVTDKLEEYVMGILPAQIPVTYEEEALKAQAVIIRTNLLYKSREFYGEEDIDRLKELIEEGDLQQMGFTYYNRMELEQLWGYDQFELYENKIRQAAEETRGKVLTWEGEPVDLPYHAVSAGKTRSGSVLNGAYPYLEPVECPGDVEAVNYLDIQVIALAEAPEILSRDESGYVTQVRLGEETLPGEEFRVRYQLNSSCFTAEAVEGGVRITTKGLGHGLGLSMYEANLQALDGSDFLEILLYFYKNVECISFS